MPDCAFWENLHFLSDFSGEGGRGGGGDTCWNQRLLSPVLYICHCHRGGLYFTLTISALRAQLPNLPLVSRCRMRSHDDDDATADRTEECDWKRFVAHSCRDEQHREWQQTSKSRSLDSWHCFSHKRNRQKTGHFLYQSITFWQELFRSCSDYH